MPFFMHGSEMIAAENPLPKPSTRKPGMKPRFFVAFWCVFRLIFAPYCFLNASFVSFPVKILLRADFPVFAPFFLFLIPNLSVLPCCASLDSPGSRSVLPENSACSYACSSGRYG